MRKWTALLVCVAVLAGCAASSLPEQGEAQPLEAEKVDAYLDEPVAYLVGEGLPCMDENGEEEEIIAVYPDVFVPQYPDPRIPELPPDIDWERQATLVLADTFLFKLESLLAPSEYGGIFWRFQDNNYDVYLNIWAVDFAAVTNAVHAAFAYFEGREFTPFDIRFFEASASLEELERLSAQIREIALEGDAFQFLTPLLREEYNKLLVHGVVLDEPRIRSEVHSLARTNGITEEIIVFDLHCALEDIPSVPGLQPTT